MKKQIMITAILIIATAVTTFYCAYKPPVKDDTVLKAQFELKLWNQYTSGLVIEADSLNNIKFDTTISGKRDSAIINRATKNFKNLAIIISNNILHHNRYDFQIQ